MYTTNIYIYIVLKQFIFYSMACDQDNGKACLKCESNCPGFTKHPWRMVCTQCHCAYLEHDITDDDAFTNQSILDELELNKCSSSSSLCEEYTKAQRLAKQFELHWLPIGIKQEEVELFLNNLPTDELPRGEFADHVRRQRFRKQIPLQDRRPNVTIEQQSTNLKQYQRINFNLEVELNEANRFKHSRNCQDFGIGQVEHMNIKEGQHRLTEAFLATLSSSSMNYQPAWHLKCFRCITCNEFLVDYCYAWLDGRPYCLRHYAQLIRPRCITFWRQLIFSEEYTRAMDQEHHAGHFACHSCDASLTGQRYILRDDEPHCLACYEAKFANTCEQCKEKIGCDSKDLSFKERHWHEKCFKCSACTTSLADRPFATKEEQLYCSDCYDERFAARCDGCQGVFKAGMRKYEYRGQQWHEECFLCVECKQPIGAKSFIPRENQVVCVPCYEAKYAQRCTKCSDVIRRGGVTYKGNPWHKDCFTCTSCGKQLAGLKFTSKDEQPYCADCYGELFAKKCTKCTKPITDRHWHSECFLCGKCNSNLVGRGFLTSDDMIMCSDCGR
ncbi:Four and a half LIM domains protein 2 [Schistosoma japonicum]|nr:Four and a half LIM domains protein 2 [Schistosoma japonicum]